MELALQATFSITSNEHVYGVARVATTSSIQTEKIIDFYLSKFKVNPDHARVRFVRLEFCKYSHKGNQVLPGFDFVKGNLVCRLRFCTRLHVVICLFTTNCG